MQLENLFFLVHFHHVRSALLLIQTATTSTSSLTVPPPTLGICFFLTKTPPLDSSQLEGKAKARRWWKSGCRRRSGESPRGAAGSVRTRFHYSPTVPTVVLTFTSENTNANVRAALRGKSDDRQSPDLIQWHGAQRRSRLCLGVAGWCRWGRRRLPHTHSHTHSSSQYLGWFLYIRMGIVGSGCRI